LDRGVLCANRLLEWPSFDPFENALAASGPWIAGIDFPFGQSRKFVENIGWPTQWCHYVTRARGLGRNEFCGVLKNYRANRTYGDREHRRRTDKASGSISPQKLHGTPVGLMFFEGAARLVDAGVSVPGLLLGDPERIVVEAYPGILVRRLIGRRRYKNDNRKKQTVDQHLARKEVLRRVTRAQISDYNVAVEAPGILADDPTGDHLDALLCAIQAAWAWTQREHGFGAPNDFDSLEGWIADPQSTAAYV
jgi:hypothetical protein